MFCEYPVSHGRGADAPDRPQIAKTGLKKTRLLYLERLKSEGLYDKE